MKPVLYLCASGKKKRKDKCSVYCTGASPHHFHFCSNAERLLCFQKVFVNWMPVVGGKETGIENTPWCPWDTTPGGAQLGFGCFALQPPSMLTTRRAGTWVSSTAITAEPPRAAGKLCCRAVLTSWGQWGAPKKRPVLTNTPSAEHRAHCTHSSQSDPCSSYPERAPRRETEIMCRERAPALRLDLHAFICCTQRMGSPQRTTHPAALRVFPCRRCTR